MEDGAASLCAVTSSILHSPFSILNSLAVTARLVSLQQLIALALDAGNDRLGALDRVAHALAPFLPGGLELGLRAAFPGTGELLGRGAQALERIAEMLLGGP